MNRRKLCPGCPERGPQPLGNFALRTASKDGRQRLCRVCQSDRVKAKRKQDKLEGKQPPRRKDEGTRAYMRDYMRRYRGTPVPGSVVTSVPLRSGGRITFYKMILNDWA